MARRGYKGESGRNKGLRWRQVKHEAEGAQRDTSFRGRENFMAPGERGGFLGHSRDGAVFLLAELDGTFHRGFVQHPAPSINNFQVYPDRGGLRGRLAGTTDLPSLKFLALFFE